MADFLRGSAVPLAASGPSLDEQIEQLSALGLDLHPDCDPSMLARAVSRGATPEDLGGRGGGAHPIPPHRRACYWWLLCEDVGGTPALGRRVRIDLSDFAFAAGYADEDELPLAEQIALIRRISHRLRAVIPGARSLHLSAVGGRSSAHGAEDGTSAERGSERVRVGGRSTDWSGRGLRERLREALWAVLPEHERLVMYRDLVPDAPDVCLVVPSVHESAVRGLIQEVLPPALAAGVDWMERVEHHSTSEQVPFTLSASRMTSGLALSSVDVPPWTGVHPPMALAEQIENLRRVGLLPWTDDLAERLPLRRPSRVPRMCDRPYHDLFTTPGTVAHRGLLRGLVHLPEKIPDEGRSSRVGAVLTRSVRAMAEVARPGLAIPRVELTPLCPDIQQVTALIDGRVIRGDVRRVGGRRPYWDAEEFLELVAAELRDDAQRWVALRPGSRSEPVIAALVALWNADEILEMARLAFGDEGRHRAASAQERTWHRWSDRTRAHDLMLSMTPSARLAALESCGISLIDASDTELTERAAANSTWTGLLGAAHRGHRSVLSHVCVWSAREIADQRVEGLPGAARKVARSVGRDDVELRIIGSEGGPGALELDVAGQCVRLMDRLPAPEEMCEVIGEIAVRVTPPGRDLVTLGETRLWPLESRAAELRMLLSGG